MVAETSAALHDRLVIASEEQRRRLNWGATGTQRWNAPAARYRFDPRREIEGNLEVIASYLRSDDVLLDVGGGAGRFGLPLSLRCRELINIEPSAGMGAEFEALVQEAGITNSRWIHADWLAAPAVVGDVSFVSYVTYYVHEIRPFVEKLIACSRRRVMIVVHSLPSPDQIADVFRLVRGEELALVPGYRELLPVLWDMGILPDIRVLGPAYPVIGDPLYPTREAAADFAVRQVPTPDPDASRGVIEEHFDELFSSDDGGYRRRMASEPRMMLLTWEVSRT